MELDAAMALDVRLADVPELASRAERLGFGALWMAETRRDPFLPLALVAEHTSRISFGTAVTVAFARSPTVVAQTAWDLSERSGGRFILGLGTQVRAHIERRFGMPWSGRPVSQLRDYVAAVRAIWRGWQSGEPVRHRGPYYRVTLMTPFFSPPSMPDPRIPIYLAGVGTSMCSLAGEVADGLIVHPLHSMRYLAEVVRPAIRAGAERAGRPSEAVRMSGNVLVGIGPVEREAIREQIAFYASTPSYSAVLALHGWADLGEALSRLARHGRWDEMARLVSDEMLETFAVTGTWDEVAGGIERRYAGLLDRVSLYRAFGTPSEDEEWGRLIAAVAATTPVR